jgi:hypothetical protein
VSILFAGGETREIGRVPHQPGGAEQSFRYVFTADDLGGFEAREVRFQVQVVDLAGNHASDTSDPVLLVSGLPDYRAELVAPTDVRVRFATPVTGQTSAPEWRYDLSPDGDPADDMPVRDATVSRSGSETTVMLDIPAADDVNAELSVRYEPLATNVSPLRGAAGADVSQAEHSAADLIQPVLGVTTTAPTSPVDADAFTVDGYTDPSNRPNVVLVHAVDGDGVVSDAIGAVRAGRNGRFSVTVPITADTTTRLVARAVDPAGNTSGPAPDRPLSIAEDSSAPVVTLLEPTVDAGIGPVARIRWRTHDAHPSGVVDVAYRVDGGHDRAIARHTPDDGALDWTLPREAHGAALTIVVRATDQMGRTASTAVTGVRVDREPPRLLGARATGAQVVELTLSESARVVADAVTVDGRHVRRVGGTALRRVIVLDGPVASTTPRVTMADGALVDSAGNAAAASTVRARRSFVFAVRGLRSVASQDSTRLVWRDGRNSPENLQGYRVYRDGMLVAAVTPDTMQRRISPTRAATWSVRVIDDRGRVSSPRALSVVPTSR